MTGASVLDGAILAAGSGSRLRGDGWTMPKPMVPVAGVPLIEHVIRNFTAAGVTSLVIIVNEEARDIAPTGPAVTEFHVAKASGWPVGHYKVEVSADGTVAATKEFEVKK